MEDQENALAEKVKAGVYENGAERDMKIKVFSIVGFGGLGKTTLAMEVCRQLEVVFYRQAQVLVSQMFNMGEDLKELLKRVRQQMFKREAGNEEGNKENDPLASIDMMDADQLGSKLKALLNNKRYI
jgi:disease resistance protein RPM1